jgi:hypothetical protein
MRHLAALLSLGVLTAVLTVGLAFANCDSCGSGPCGCQKAAKQHCDCKSCKREKDRCGGCKSQSYCRCKAKGRSCWGGKGVWVEDETCPCGLKPMAPETVCAGEGKCGCGGGHPYEQCFNGSSMICDTSCGTYLPCKRVCLQCETKVTERTTSCGCDCHTDYCVSQDCQQLGRPRVVPWWFTGGQGRRSGWRNAPARSCRLAGKD